MEGLSRIWKYLGTRRKSRLSRFNSSLRRGKNQGRGENWKKNWKNYFPFLAFMHRMLLCVCVCTGCVYEHVGYERIYIYYPVVAIGLGSCCCFVYVLAGYCMKFGFGITGWRLNRLLLVSYYRSQIWISGVKKHFTEKIALPYLLFIVILVLFTIITVI